jgi:glycosyltransferase involved in cell wall biosynthesis
MSNDPLVSVIIPTYNYSTVLRCAIESVLLQTLTNFELLVIGDGCTDDSEEVVKSFDDERIYWENLPENSGNQALPNMRGLELARGHYVAYLGHDDLWLPHHLETVVRTLQTNQKAVTASMAVRFGPLDVGTRCILNLGEDFKHWIPGVMLHERDLGLQVGWKQIHELDSHIDTNGDFTSRLKETVGDGFIPTYAVTELNFPAAHRPNSYKTKDSTEQEYYLERIRNDDNLLEKLLLETILLAKKGLYTNQRVEWLGDRTGKPGEIVEAMRRLKGLEGDGRDIQELYVVTNPHRYRLQYKLGFISRVYRAILRRWHRLVNR